MRVDAPLPRIRQVVLAARDLDAMTARVREELGLGEPFADPGVGYFGLRNAVFAIGDTFLEVVSPIRPDASAARLLERRGRDCGYMLMFQVEDLVRARERAQARGVREVFELSLEDMAEVHLHPGDMRGAIVSLSEPRPPQSWRWGGPGWRERSAALSVSGATLAVRDPAAVRATWEQVIGGLPGVTFTDDESEPGLVEIAISRARARARIELGGVQFELGR
jgi:catechol 2,3-dioxygenase-like lactoylglutathione lyase family enzyme